MHSRHLEVGKWNKRKNSTCLLCCYECSVAKNGVRASRVRVRERNNWFGEEWEWRPRQLHYSLFCFVLLCVWTQWNELNEVDSGIRASHQPPPLSLSLCCTFAGALRVRSQHQNGLLWLEKKKRKEKKMVPLLSSLQSC